MNTISEKNSQDFHVSTGAALAPADKVLTRVPSGTSAARHPAAPATADPPSQPGTPATPTDGSFPVTQPQPPVSAPPVHRYRKWLLLAGTVASLAVGGYFLFPWVHTALSTVSTDDAYVNGHVTLVAPAYPGR